MSTFATATKSLRSGAVGSALNALGAVTKAAQTSQSAATAAAPPPPPAPAPSGMIYSGDKTKSSSSMSENSGAAMRSDVDYNNDTVEGRIGNLLQRDERGDYTHDLVRQAVDRQNQKFNSRGLLNSSMAQQAGQEAAISKAIEIAGPDAATYAAASAKRLDREFQEKTRLDEQDFQLRGDYQKAVSDVNTNFQKMVDTINSSQMTPEDKSVAVAQAQSVRDGELAYQNNLYSNMPRWKNEWLALAVPVEGVDIAAINNRDTLSNIANDPAQTAERRQAARDRLASGGATGQGSNFAPGFQPGGAGSGDMGNFPSAVDGASVKWDQPVNIGMMGPRTTPRQQYAEYMNNGGYLSPEAWWRLKGRSGAAGGHDGGDGTDPSDGGSAAAAASAASGVGL